MQSDTRNAIVNSPQQKEHGADQGCDEIARVVITVTARHGRVIATRSLPTDLKDLQAKGIPSSPTRSQQRYHLTFDWRGFVEATSLWLHPVKPLGSFQLDMELYGSTTERLFSMKA